MFLTEITYSDGVICVPSNGRIGRYVFFPKEIENHFKKFPKKLTMVDVACGMAADHPLLYDFFDKKGIELNLIGVDINKNAIDYTKKGKIAYGLEIALEIKNNKLVLDENSSLNSISHKSYTYKDITDYFEEYKPRAFDGVKDMSLNPEKKRWVMNEKTRNRLNLVVGDATSLAFEDNYADIVISENLLFGRRDSLGNRIRKEMKRILKPNGFYYTG